MLAVENKADKEKSSGCWPSTTRSRKESPADAGCRSARRLTTKIQRTLAVDKEVDDESPADAGGRSANGHFVPYRIVLLLDLQENRSFRVKSSFEKTRVKVFF